MRERERSREEGGREGQALREGGELRREEGMYKDRKRLGERTIQRRRGTETRERERERDGGREK